MKSSIFAGAVALSFLGTGMAQASLLAVTSYNMPNGDGQAQGGWLNYWDATYSNCIANDCTTDGLAGSYLSGGLGKLTDGIVATQPWYDVSDAAGTGQYVGWLSSNPMISFNFAGDEVVNEVKLFVDNSHVGGVAAPVSIVIDGVTYFNPPSATPSAPELIDITGLYLTGASVSVTLNNPNSWVFMSEAQFITGAPEPSTWAMMMLGFAGLGYAGYRQTKRASPALS
jgi:PEP-CTERM motif